MCFHPTPQCLKYKTDQQADVKKMEKLNSLFFVLNARGEHPTGEKDVEQHANANVPAPPPPSHT